MEAGGAGLISVASNAFAEDFWHIVHDKDRALQAKYEEMVRLLFRHTSTIGVRESVCRRWVLRRESGEVTTPYGPVRVKRSEGYGVTKTKAEYDDLAAIAREHGLTLDEVRRLTVED